MKVNILIILIEAICLLAILSIPNIGNPVIGIFLVIAICVAEGIIVRKLERSSNIQIRGNAKWKRAAVFIIIFFFAFIGVALCLYFNLKNIY